MAFKNTSGTIIIDAVLTDLGRKKVSRGTLNITKFALGDDEINYETFSAADRDDSGYYPELTGSQIFEAYGSRHKNIQYGLISKDESAFQNDNWELEHAWIIHMPILKLNDKIAIVPELRDGVYYLSVNDETTEKINEIFSNTFKFLSDNAVDKRKIVVESGLDQIPALDGGLQPPDIHPSQFEKYFAISPEAREYFIEKKYLLDQDFYVFADNRFIVKTLGINTKSVFKNYKNGESQINFESLIETSPISIESQFTTHATYLIKGIKNLMFDFYDELSSPSTAYSSLDGPKGTVVAMNFIVNGYLKNNSTATRDFRYSKYGKIDEYLFDSTHKFDYVDTTVYIVGAATQSRVQVPLRLIRYAGT
jgi:hypothetical protein